MIIFFEKNYYEVVKNFSSEIRGRLLLKVSVKDFNF